MLIPGTTFSDYTPKIDYESLYLSLVEHINNKAQELGISQDKPSVMIDKMIELSNHKGKKKKGEDVRTSIFYLEEKKRLTEAKKQKIAKQLAQYASRRFKANDNVEYILHIEGLEGAQCACVFDETCRGFYEIFDICNNKAWFTRPLNTRKTAENWFGPVCGPSQWYITLES